MAECEGYQCSNDFRIVKIDPKEIVVDPNVKKSDVKPLAVKKSDVKVETKRNPPKVKIYNAYATRTIAIIKHG